MAYQLLKGKEVAQKLGISVSFAYQLMRYGRIPSIRIGRSIRVNPYALEEFITTNTVSKKDISIDHEVPDLAENQRLHGQK